jgi:hypothetical protein
MPLTQTGTPNEFADHPDFLSFVLGRDAAYLADCIGRLA